MVTAPTRRGWQSGIMSAVRLAAWMPAMRAAPSTSPLVMALLATLPVVSGFMNTLHRDMARRWVASLGVTSTMRARPSGSRWVRPRSDMAAVYRGRPTPGHLDRREPARLGLADGLSRRSGSCCGPGG